MPEKLLQKCPAVFLHDSPHDGSLMIQSHVRGHLKQ
jgi:hypothetical protein